MGAMILLRNDSEEGIDMQRIWALFKHIFKRDATRKNRTKHVQEERVAIQYRNELEAAFDALADGIILFDKTGRGKFVNKGYHDLFIAGEPDV